MRTLLGFYPKDNKVKIIETGGKIIEMSRTEFEESMIAGHEYLVKLKKGTEPLLLEKYEKVKDRLWSM